MAKRAGNEPDPSPHNRAQREWFDREAGAYERQWTRIGRRNHDAKMAALDRLLGLGNGRSLLEVGAGSGMHLEWIAASRPDLSYLGIDLSDGMLQEARRKGLLAPARRLAAGDALRLPVPDGRFDGAFAVDVVHHVPDPETMLREMGRAVRHGGPVAVLEPNWVFPVNLIYLARPVEWGVFRSRVGNLVRWAKSAGWSEVRPVRLPVYFPPFPARLFPLYRAFEGSIGRFGAARYFSTTLGVMGRAGGGSTSGRGGSSPGV